jgi:protein-disulfide isomerase
VRVRGAQLSTDADLDAVLTRVRRALFGLASVVPPERATAEPDGFSVRYALTPNVPSFAQQPPADAVAVALELAHAIGELHDRGFSHGALDPQLLFVTAGGLRILGAGLCDVPQKGSHNFVDPVYLAPELVVGAAPSARSDVFALGAILLRILDLPEGPLRNVASAAAAPEPSARPSDAWALRDALKHARTAAAEQRTLGDSTQSATEPVQTRSESAAPDGAPSEPSARTMPEAKAPQLPTAQAPHAPHSAPRDSKHDSAWAILFMLGGGLLLLLGFAGVFAFAFLRTTSPSVSTAPVASSAVAPLPGVGPLPADPPDAAAPEAPEPAEPVEPSEPQEPPEEPAPSDPALTQKPSEAQKQPPGSAVSPLPAGADLPSQGPPDAAVTLIVFGDLACAHTRRSMDVLRKLRTAFPSDLRTVFRHRPLPQHANAESAARTAAGVHLDHGSDAFFRLLNKVSATPGTASRSEIRSALRAASIPDTASWQSDPRVLSRLQDDQRLAGIFAVRQTPTLFVNGERFEGFQDYRSMETAIKKERAAARGLAAQGVRSSALYAARVRKNMIGIGLDVPDRICPTVGNEPARGAPDPLVTIVEFSDFECRYCKKLAPALDQVLAKRGGDVRLVWRNFPLANHGRARVAASLALQANKQLGARGFWQAHDRLFDSQNDLSDPALSTIAKNLGLEPVATLRAIKSDVHAATIAADIGEGTRVGVRGTPTLFVNGRSVPGARSAVQLLTIVDEEIEWARRLTRSGTPRHRIYAAVCGN